MTHRQALNNQRGWPASDCDGQLAELHAQVVPHCGADDQVDHLVRVYQCEGCGRRVSLANAIEPDGRAMRIPHVVLNDYDPNPSTPRDMAAALAVSFGRNGS